MRRKAIFLPRFTYPEGAGKEIVFAANAACTGGKHDQSFGFRPVFMPNERIGIAIPAFHVNLRSNMKR